MPASNNCSTARLGWSQSRKESSRRVSSVHGTSSSLKPSARSRSLRVLYLGDRRRQRSAFHWPNPVRQNQGFLANRLILDLRDYSSLQCAFFGVVVPLPCHPSS